MADRLSDSLKRAEFIRRHWPLISPWQHAPFLREACMQSILKEEWAKADAQQAAPTPAPPKVA
jgi:hypothetical protein